MGRACSKYGEGKFAYGWRDLRETDNLEDLDLDVTIILKCIFKKCERRGHGVD
jgi:hypothetical protein